MTDMLENWDGGLPPPSVVRMPNASPAAIVSWSDRIGRGLLLGIVASIVGTVVYSVFQGLGLGAFWGTVTLSPLAMIVHLISAWWITTPEPGDGLIRQPVRRCARFLVVFSSVVTLVRIVCVALFPHLSIEVLYCGAIVLAATNALPLLSIGVIVWYEATLADRANDRALRTQLRVLKWLALVGWALMTLMSLATWRSSVQSAMDTVYLAWHAPYGGGQPFAMLACIVVVIWGMVGYGCYLSLRLRKKLALAARQIRRPTPQGPEEGPD